MIRRRNAILLALGLLVPVALVDAPAGALDQDLVASVTAGPPGTAVTLSSATCVDPTDESAFLEASLLVGTAPNQQIAAYASGSEGSVTLTVPDWVDADQPAVIEATCQIFTEEGDGDLLEYDPIAFDVEAGSGTPVQVRSFSRTELLAGQGTAVSGSCGPDLPNAMVYAVAFEGTDQSGKDLGSLAGEGWAEAGADGSFDLDLVVTDAYVSLGVETDSSQVTGLSVEEQPMSLAPGDYTAFVYCSADGDGSLQFLEPQPLTVTGAAPTGEIDLLNDAGTRDVTLAGTCDAGEVTGTFDALSADDLTGEYPDPELDLAARANRFAPVGAAGDPSSGQIRIWGGSDRALSDGSSTEFGVSPGDDGSWQVDDAAGFDQGIVIATASCGDPMADGFVYDPQGVAIEVDEPVTTVPATVPPTTPAPPANAVSGRPTYAG